MRFHAGFALLVPCLVLASVARADDLSTAFTYQGELEQSAVPVDGTADFQIDLYDADTGGSSLGSVTALAVPIDDGRFTLELDYGATTFDGKSARWLEIQVRSPAGSGAYTTLSPRQPITVAPYALQTRGIYVDDEGYVQIRSDPAMLPAGGLFGVISDLGSLSAMNVVQASDQGGVAAQFSVTDAANPATTVVVSHAGNGLAFKASNLGDGGAAFFQSGSPTKAAVHAFGVDATGEAGIFQGKVGIGTVEPEQPLHVVGLSKLEGDLQAYEDMFCLGHAGVEGPHTPGFGLTVHTNAAKPLGGTWSVFSDRRLKQNVEPLAGSLDRLLELRGVTFEYNDPEHFSYVPGTHVGMIAQQVERVFPEWVEEKPDGFKAVTYSGFEALTIEALREVRAEKDAQIAALEERVARLEQLVVDLAANADGVPVVATTGE